VEFDCDNPPAEAAETPAISNPAASATDICFLAVALQLGHGR
jgi:hypothetical protein